MAESMPVSPKGIFSNYSKLMVNVLGKLKGQAEMERQPTHQEDPASFGAGGIRENIVLPKLWTRGYLV